jgi:hypothetical protein
MTDQLRALTSGQGQTDQVIVRIPDQTAASRAQ